MINNKLSFKKRFKKLIFWKNKKINGIIDYISPFTIKGWYKGIDNSSEIQLRINNVTILKTYANEYRKDVCEKLEWIAYIWIYLAISGCYRFSL